MFSEEIYTRDSASVLEERRLLQQIISLGVGYPYGKSWGSNAAISNMGKLYLFISRLVSFQISFDVDSITREEEKRLRNGEGGYYIINLYSGRIFARGKHPIEDIIFEFTLLDTNNRVQFRWRKGTQVHNVAFLIAPKGVFCVWKNRAFIPLNEFHMISFIGSDDKSKSGFVVDYDAAQNNRPLVLFPCEENNDIIQAQLEQDDRCLKDECESLSKDIGFDW